MQGGEAFTAQQSDTPLTAAWRAPANKFARLA